MIISVYAANDTEVQFLFLLDLLNWYIVDSSEGFLWSGGVYSAGRLLQRMTLERLFCKDCYAVI